MSQEDYYATLLQRLDRMDKMASEMYQHQNHLSQKRNELRMDLLAEITDLHDLLTGITGEVDFLIKRSRELISSFKQSVPQSQLERVTRRVDNLDLENWVTKKELKKIIFSSS